MSVELGVDHLNAVDPVYTYTIEPATPRKTDEVRVRIDSSTGCHKGATAILVEVEKRELRFGAGFSDAGEPGCRSEHLTPRYRSFGVLPKGTYTVTFEHCISNPAPGFPRCRVIDTRTLLVEGGDPVVVPALLDGGALALIAFIVMTGITRVWTCTSNFGRAEV